MRFNGAPIDPNHGTSTYWLHASAADGNGRTTGGFTLDLPSRSKQMVGKITTIEINGAPAGHPGAAKAPAPGAPSIVKMTGRCDFAGEAYKVEIEGVGDVWRPATRPGARGASLRGSLHLKMTAEKPGAPVNDARSAAQSSVQIWIK